jgi:beta-carotene 3-hydroxylase
MSHQILVNTGVVLASVLAMEWIAWASHKYVMHRWGWGWHRSHHESKRRGLERNDLYAIVFAAVAIVLIALGNQGLWPLTWVGLGMTIYGFLYFVVHDGLVHRRWPFRHVPKRGYLKRLLQAHRLHHAVQARNECVSFGFLYAPPVAGLRDEFRARVRSASNGGQREPHQIVRPESGGSIVGRRASRILNP